ncbi:hypothetical protein ES703_53687 [subsurface metagenome]
MEVLTRPVYPQRVSTWGCGMAGESCQRRGVGSCKNRGSRGFLLGTPGWQAEKKVGELCLRKRIGKKEKEKKKEIGTRVDHPCTVGRGVVWFL